jgi:hypothetical protein
MSQNEELLDGDFKLNSPKRAEQEKYAERLARGAGWYVSLLSYVNGNTGNSYRISDMDGWADLCGNEGITS